MKISYVTMSGTELRRVNLYFLFELFFQIDSCYVIYLPVYFYNYLFNFGLWKNPKSYWAEFVWPN